VFDEVVHVPLVFWGPGPFAEPRVISESVGLIDVLPTFLDWAGLRALPGTEGRSILPLLRGEEEGHAVLGENFVPSELTRPGLTSLQVFVRTQAWKYVAEADLNARTITERLFHVAEDPGETEDRMGDAQQGRLAPPTTFCRALERARDRLWHEVESWSAPAEALGPTPVRGAPLRPLADTTLDGE
jgi:arylsulfatase A-like enzyme